MWLDSLLAAGDLPANATVTSTDDDFWHAEESIDDGVIEGSEALTTDATAAATDDDNAAALGISSIDDLRPFRFFLFFPGTCQQQTNEKCWPNANI